MELAAVTRESAPGFSDWMRRVDAYLGRWAGVGHDDLADQCWRDWFDDGMSARSAAEEALENEGFPSGGLE